MNEKELSKNADTLFRLCFFAYCVSYIGRLHFSACMPDIIADIGITKTMAGAITTCFLACYGTGQLVNGILGDHIHPRYMIFAGLLGAGVSNLLISFSSSYYAIFILWGLSGVFNSMLWSPVIRCLSEWIPDSKKQKYGVGIAFTIPVGMIASYLVSSLVLHVGEWHKVFSVCGGLLAVASVIWFIEIGRLKGYMESFNANRVLNIDSAAKDTVPKNVSLPKLLFGYGIIFSAVSILFNGVLKDGVTQWVPTYVTEFFNVTASTASAVTIILPIINLSGAVIASLLNRHIFKNELKTASALFLISAGAIALLYFFGSINIVLAVALISVSTATMLGVNSMLLTFIPLHFGVIGKASTVTGFLNACSYIASALSSVTIGWIAENMGWSATILSWLAVGLLGASACATGISAWRKGNKKLDAISAMKS